MYKRTHTWRVITVIKYKKTLVLFNKPDACYRPWAHLWREKERERERERERREKRDAALLVPDTSRTHAARHKHETCLSI